MSIQQLRCVVAVAQLGSCSKAATELCVTPQAVSKAIKTIEKKVGADLFVAENGSVLMTDYGKIFASRAATILREYDGLINSWYVGESQDEKILNIAIAEYSGVGSLLPREILEEFALTYPSIKIEWFGDTSENCLRALKNEMVSGAILIGEYKKHSFECTHIGSVGVAAIVNASDELVMADEVWMRDLSGRTVARPVDLRCVYPVLREASDAIGFNRIEYANVGQSDADRCEFVGGGGVLLVPRGSEFALLHDDVVEIPLNQDMPKIEIPLCFVSNRLHRTPALDVFRNYLKASAELGINMKSCL